MRPKIGPHVRALLAQWGPVYAAAFWQAMELDALTARVSRPLPSLATLKLRQARALEREAKLLRARGR